MPADKQAIAYTHQIGTFALFTVNLQRQPDRRFWSDSLLAGRHGQQDHTGQDSPDSHSDQGSKG